MVGDGAAGAPVLAVEASEGVIEGAAAGCVAGLVAAGEVGAAQAASPHRISAAPTAPASL
jgi:hypothetical protein